MGTRLALVLAVVLGIVSAVAVRAWIQQQEAQTEAKYVPVAVAVAGRDLRAGEVVRQADMKVDMLEKAFVVAGMLTRDEAPLYDNRVLNRDIRRGEPFFKAFLDAPAQKRQTTASVVKEGMRAVTLRVDQISGVGGLVGPGDYVDVVATFDQRDGQARTIKTIFLLQAARVVAVDNRTLEVTTQRGAGTYRSVTLELSPSDAMRAINAQSQGEIHLLLRARADVAETAAKQGERTIDWDVSRELKQTVDHVDVKPGK